MNRAVPLVYPKLARKFGDVVPYDQAKKGTYPNSRSTCCWSARRLQKLQAYHDFIGFKVAEPLLQRAFRETYGLEMKDLFLSEDLAMGTFRHAVGKTIPDVTKVAWEKKQEQIRKTTPGALRDAFVLTLPKQAYEKEYGTDYAKPHGLARVLGWLYVLVPKIGPLRPLAFKVPTPEAESLFLVSLTRTRERFGESLAALRNGRLALVNINLDTGRPSAPGEYELADKTHAELEKRLRQMNRSQESRRAAFTSANHRHAR